MNSKTQAVNLMILGKEYRVACDEEDQESLIQSAHQLDVQMRKMRDSGKINGAERVAVMAALNLAHELQMLKIQNETLKASLNEGLVKMNHKIENVLENH